MEKISWSDRVKNKVLHKSQEGKEYPTCNNQRKATWTGRILTRNCLLKYVIEGQLEVIGRRERTRKLKDGSTRLHSANNSLWKSLWI